MIHPRTLLVEINDNVGFGVIATEYIPKGTIMYTKDELDITISSGSPILSDTCYLGVIEKYSYIDSEGNFIISWDHAKYVNHSCNANTLTTGYGFEISIRDIAKGEEITDDYGIFIGAQPLICACGSNSCRGEISASKFDETFDMWDTKIKDAMANIHSVDQPLYSFLDSATKVEIATLIGSSGPYKSVLSQKPFSAIHLDGTVGESGSKNSFIVAAN